ncbi:VOC family protein [Ancylobacter sp. 6x-1]|uniref:VOC family protein n=1 Tax=Ancylobacter crimeensis TaxID=2579147 RepID=A0ABT0D8F7_9HYPH|nr:VOC family protein [Ancylobacter crimeensis]MCK0196246.1 VOC family protein [Ancylobacter crimeensis]
MTVLRIVPNIATDDIAKVVAFYRKLLDLEPVMDHGWIVTLAGAPHGAAQLGIASEGGSGTPVPDLSIEVDDLDMVLARMRAMGVTPAYGPAEEPWGVRRVYVRDPAGRLVNILCHGRGGNAAAP